jgi:hypothetical protein
MANRLSLKTHGNGQGLGGVEDSLLPVGVLYQSAKLPPRLYAVVKAAHLGLGTGAKVDRLVAARERNVEPSEESVHVYTHAHQLVRFQQEQSIGPLPLTVISRRLELKGDLERQVLLLDGPDVNVLDSAGVADDGSELNAVDERFSESNVLDARVVKAIDVVPDCSSRHVSSAVVMP